MAKARNRRQRVALIGEFGVRNYGNEASLAHWLRVLRSVDTVEPTVICHDADLVAALHQVPAQPFFSHHPESRIGRGVWKLRDFFRAARCVAGFDVLIVPGTGVFDLQATRVGEVPYVLFTYSFWAAVLRRPFLFLGVGADRGGSRMSQLLARFAARRASVLTARDRQSAALLSRMSGNPVDVLADAVFGDEFGSGQGSAGHPGPVVGLGLFDYQGHGGPRHPDLAERELFVSRMGEIARGLIERSMDVVLLRGEDSDEAAVEAVMSRLGTEQHVRVSGARSVPEVAEEISSLDALVACRYHNLIPGAIQRVPMIALGWSKQQSLAAQLGRTDDFFDIGEFEPTHVLSRVDAILADGELAQRAELNEHVRRLSSLVEQQDRWLAHVLSAGDVSRHALRRSGGPHHVEPEACTELADATGG